MGAGNSVPLWLNPNGTPSNYDMWGFIPQGMDVPPQHATSQAYDWGFPNSAPLRTTYYQTNGRSNNWNTVLLVGQQNDILATFGSKLPIQEVSTSKEQNSTFTVGGFYSQSPNAVPWNPTDTPVCDPTTYPNCSMTSMRAAASTISPHINFWAAQGYPPVFGGPGTATNVMDRYVSKIDEHVANFAAGKYAGLANVCSKDTSGYDPCTTGLFERILPFLLGIAGVALLKVYGVEFLSFLPSQSIGYLYLTTFGTLYQLGTAIEEFSIGKTEDGTWTDEVNKAAGALTLGVGAIVASYQLSGEAYVLPATIGAALLSKMLFQRIAFIALTPAAAGGGVLVAVPLMILHWVEKFFCWLSNAGMSACDDFGENAGGTSSGFPDARRWDVASLAAKLTDIACEENYWSRDSAQAKFVYRGLLLNPQWMQAATTSKDILAGNSLWNQTDHMLNPLGLIAPIHESGSTVQSSHGDWAQSWSSDQLVFTGKNDTKDGGDPITDSNRFACQNFDILYWGDECGGMDDPECSGSNPPPKCNNKCPDFSADDGADGALADNMRKSWLQKLVAAAADPNNIAQQYNIPDAYNSWDTTHIPGYYKRDVFLKTCHEDFDGTSGLGFNTVQQRGKFANYYISSKVDHPVGAEHVEFITNNMFYSCNSLSDAWKIVESTFSKRNKTAFAHYVYKPKGDLQTISFNTWEDHFEDVRKWKDDPFHINEGFEPPGILKIDPSPLTHLGPLAPVKTVPLPVGLKPALPRGGGFIPYETEWLITNAIGMVDGNIAASSIEAAATYLDEKTNYPNNPDYAHVSFTLWVQATLLEGMPGFIAYPGSLNYPAAVVYAINHPVVARETPDASEIDEAVNDVYFQFSSEGSFDGFLTLLPPAQRAIFETHESIQAWLNG